MSKPRKWKPLNPQEWILIVLALILVVITGILVLREDLLPQQEADKVKLEAVTEPSPTASPAPSANRPAASGESTESTAEGNAKLRVALEHLTRTGNDLSQNILPGQVKKLDRMSRELLEKQVEAGNRETVIPQAEGGVEEAFTIPEEELYAPQEEPLPQVAQPAQPTNQPSQAAPVSPLEVSASETEKVVTGPTSPPPLKNRPTEAPGPTSPAPLKAGQESMVGSPPALEGPKNNQARNTQLAAPYDPAINPTVLPTKEELIAVQKEIFEMINRDRRAAGIAPLAYDGTLQQIANIRSQELSVYYSSTHIKPNGVYALTWIAGNYGANYGVGENIGWMDNVSLCNAERIYQAFYNSGKGHKEIMMHPILSRGAISVYCVPGPVADNNSGKPNPTNVGRIFICMNFGN